MPRPRASGIRGLRAACCRKRGTGGPPVFGCEERLLNNRYSSNTTPLRLDGGLSYANLFQLGHTAGLNFQLAPENVHDAEVFSGYSNRTRRFLPMCILSPLPMGPAASTSAQASSMWAPWRC